MDGLSYHQFIGCTFLYAHKTWRRAVGGRGILDKLQRVHRCLSGRTCLCNDDGKQFDMVLHARHCRMDMDHRRLLDIRLCRVQPDNVFLQYPAGHGVQQLRLVRQAVGHLLMDRRHSGGHCCRHILGRQGDIGIRGFRHLPINTDIPHLQGCGAPGRMA